MATATLELFDGVTTLDLTAVPFDTRWSTVGLLSSPARPIVAGNVLRDERYEPREIQLGLRIVGSSAPDLRDQIRILNDMLSFASKRQIIDDGTTKVVLKYQVGTTDSEDVSTRVLSGIWQPGGNLLNDTSLASGFSVDGVLTLLCEPFGRLPNIGYTFRILNPEQDGDSVNFIDLAGPFNSYLIFDGGGSDRIDISDAAAIQNIFDGGAEITIRVYIFSDGQGDQGIIYGKTAWSLRTLEEANSQVKLRFSYGFSGSAGGWTTTDLALNLNEWYIVGVSYDNASTANNPVISIYREATGVTTTPTLTEVGTPSGTRSTDVGSDFRIGNNSALTLNLDGRVDDVRMYNTASQFAGMDKTAELVGSEANLIGYWVIDEGTGATVYDKDLTNSNDGTITGAVWGIDSHIVGDASAPLRVRLDENGGYQSVGKMWLATRSGERRTDTLSFDVPDSEVAGTDPTAGVAMAHTGGTTGGLTTNTSGGTSGFTRWSRDSGDLSLVTGVVPSVGYSQHDIAGGSIPKGLFRVLARCSVEHSTIDISANDMTNFGFALGYVFGGKTVTPVAADAIMLAAADDEDEWHWLDLGELSIPPQALPEAELTPPALNLRIHGVYDGLGDSNSLTVGHYVEWACDQVFLLPIDESVIAVDAVPTSGNNVVWVSGISDTPGVWFIGGVTVSSVPEFNGGPLQIGPEVTRLYYLKDDIGDPSSLGSTASIQYEPQIRTL